MKYGKQVSNSSVLLLLFLFIAGSTGINLILHNCEDCEDFSIWSGLYLAPTEPEDHCCEYADHHSESNSPQEVISGACHYKIDRLKIENYTPVKPVVIYPNAFLTNSENNPGVISATSVNPVQSFIVYNKHGGRYTVTYNCQFIS